MMGRSHVVLAGVAYAALVLHPIETPLGTVAAPVLGGVATDYWSSVFLSLLVAAACGLAPDIDKGGSMASRSLGIPTRVLSWGIERSFGHRGGFHSLLGMALGYVLGELLGAAAGVTFLGPLVAFGWGVHLCTDAWTRHGVPLFWPLNALRVRLPPRFTTGSAMEAVMLTVSLVALAAWGLQPIIWPYLMSAIGPA